MEKKIAFLGTPNFAVPILRSLHINGYQISCVFSQPPRKSDRGQKVNKSPIQVAAEELNIQVKTPEKIELDTDFIKNLKLDLAIVVAYGQILPKTILDLSKNGFINIHASLLPKWRGAAPIQRSIMNLEKETGVSIMKIREKLDEGPVCNSYKINIRDKDNAETILEKLSLLAADKILDIIDEILEDKIEFNEQNHNKATYAHKIGKFEGKIKWEDTAEKIIGKIKGLYPSPGAWFAYKGERYKILKAEITPTFGKVGEVLSNYIEISCGNKKSIKVLEIQRQGKRPQKINEFVLGSLIKKGSNLNNE